ncbi:MAG TPA: DUF4349 domain-containing protein [Gaiellaceae bacterium]|nr:DUF4349 domain-containing protein [Gaiellaceae bacterium]
MSPLELVDDRFEQVARELRAGKPTAPAQLRERVESLSPPPARWAPPSLRRLAPAVALSVLAASLGVAAVVGVVHSGSKSGSRVEVFRAARSPAPMTESHGEPVPLPLGQALDEKQRALPHAAGRLQQYDASLTLRVRDTDELSRRTQQAMRVTRTLGGYVASASFDIPGRRGTSALVLRVPIDRVQRALAQFSGYGTLLSQRISVRDLQQRADAQSSRITALRRGIAALERRLEGSLPTNERDRLERLLRIEKRRLVAQQKRLRATVRRAELARVALTLVTPRSKATAAPSRLDRTLDDAGSVLARELQILLYALIVAAPLLVLGGLALVAARTQRSRSDRRLLERS